MNKKGLGRGLESLIPSKSTKSNRKDNQEGGTVEILISNINPNPHQPRESMDKASLNELALSIKEHGVLQPLIVSKIKNSSNYELLAGERRLRAAKIAGLRQVPAIIRSASEQQKLEVAIVENIQRESLNPLEEARSYSRLINEFNLNQNQVAKKVGKSRPGVANTLRILTLPDKIKKAISAGKVSMGHAKIILGVKNEKEQLKLFKNIVSGRLSVREVEKSTKRFKSFFKNKKIKAPEIIRYEEELRQALGTKVEVKNTGKRGKIIVNYYSKEELRDIVEKITNNKEAD